MKKQVFCFRAVFHCSLLLSIQLTTKVYAKDEMDSISSKPQLISERTDLVKENRILRSIQDETLSTSDLMKIIESKDSKLFESVLSQLKDLNDPETHLRKLFLNVTIDKDVDFQFLTRQNRIRNASSVNEKWNLPIWMIEKGHIDFFEMTLAAWSENYTEFFTGIHAERDEWNAKHRQYVSKTYSLYQWLKRSYDSEDLADLNKKLKKNEYYVKALELLEKVSLIQDDFDTFTDYITNQNKPWMSKQFSKELIPDTGVTSMTCLSKQQALITNDRYKNNEVIWGRPKGVYYGNFAGAAPEQRAVLYPDASSTYFVANFRLPIGARLVLKGEYPHARYFSFTAANQLGDGKMGNGNFLNGEQILPDPGSFNPFTPPNKRDVFPRNYTIYIINGMTPPNPEPNTIYTDVNDPDQRIHLAMRNYVPNEDYDGTGNVKLDALEGHGLPVASLELVSGQTIEGSALLDVLQVQKVTDPRGYSMKLWFDLIAKSRDPRYAPNQIEPVAEVFWNTDYSVTGLFEADNPLKRVTDYPATDTGGFANNPNTRYMTMPFFLEEDKILVVRGRMPSHPHTRHGENNLPLDPQVQYFSATTGASPPNGAAWHTVCDEAIPVDKDGNYTIVISWDWSRPKNATIKDGVAWLSPGAGEGFYDGARLWVGLLYIRYEGSSPNWLQSPIYIPQPTVENPYPQDAKVMGVYYPRGRYMSKVEFETKWNGSASSLGD